jgi:hypothetical protein
VLLARVPEQLRASALGLSSVRERHVAGLLASSTLLPNLTVHDNDRLLQERTKGFLVVVDVKDLYLGDDPRTAGRTTWPRAISLCPSAGATRFSLYSTVRTEAPAGTTVIAA